MAIAGSISPGHSRRVMMSVNVHGKLTARPLGGWASGGGRVRMGDEWRADPPRDTQRDDPWVVIDECGWVMATIPFIRGERAEELANGIATDHNAAAQLAAYRDAHEALAQRAARLEAALDQAGKDLVAGHIHIAEQSGEHDYRWLMRHLEDSFSRVCAARAALSAAPAPAAEAGDTRAAWMEYRDRWLKKGYDVHAYHGYAEGPLPGCNARYGADIRCSGSIDEHCHCGHGEHLALTPAAEADHAD